jgi:hypothetical protein
VVDYEGCVLIHSDTTTPVWTLVVPLPLAKVGSNEVEQEEEETKDNVEWDDCCWGIIGGAKNNGGFVGSFAIT